MKPDVEIFFTDPIDLWKKQIKQMQKILQVTQLPSLFTFLFLCVTDIMTWFMPRGHYDLVYAQGTL